MMYFKGSIYHRVYAKCLKPSMVYLIEAVDTFLFLFRCNKAYCTRCAMKIVSTLLDPILIKKFIQLL